MSRSPPPGTYDRRSAASVRMWLLDAIDDLVRRRRPGREANTSAVARTIPGEDPPPSGRDARANSGGCRC